MAPRPAPPGAHGVGAIDGDERDAQLPDRDGPASPPGWQAAGGLPADRTIDSDALRVVAAVLEGDRDAFRVLVDRESSSLVRICYRVLGDLHEAEDAAQEAFVTAYRALATWRGDGPFGAWLARIAVRIAVRQAGRRRHLTWLDPRAGDGSGTSNGHTLEELAGDGVGGRGTAVGISAAADPAAVSIAAERAARVRDAVAALQEPYREVVALRFFADLTLNEISAQSGRPLGTVKTHLHRGLQRLRSSLEAEA